MANLTTGVVIGTRAECEGAGGSNCVRGPDVGSCYALNGR